MPFPYSIVYSTSSIIIWVLLPALYPPETNFISLHSTYLEISSIWRETFIEAYPFPSFLDRTVALPLE